MTAARMPLSAVGMMAAHLFIEAVRSENMDARQLSYTVPGSKHTYRGKMQMQAAEDAWNLAKAVEEATQD